jgi:DnaJ-class molecular chaperone
MMNAYQILGVKETTPFSDIKEAYRSLRSKNHPDKGGNAIKFAEVLSAYEWILENPYVKPVDRPKPEYVKPFVSSLDDSYLFRYRDVKEEVIMPKVYEETDELGFAGYLPDGSCVYKISLAQAYVGGKLSLVIPNFDTGKYDLPPLTVDGTIIKVSFRGISSWLLGSYRDIKIVLKIAQHEIYNIEKENLYAIINTSLINVLSKNPLQLRHPNGKDVLTIQIPFNYSLGDYISLPELGFNFIQYGIKGRGNIIISIFVKLPDLDQNKLNQIGHILND